MKNTSISSYSVKSSSSNSANSDFVYTQLNVKIVLYKTNHFIVNIVSI